MLPAGARLRRADDFARTLRTGRRGTGAARDGGERVLVTHLSTPAGAADAAVPDAIVPDATVPDAVAAPEALPTPTRVGFVVSRAVGPAVVRNRVRRRLRHLAAQRLGAVPAGSTLVIRALPGAAAASYAGLGAALDAALRRSAPRPRADAGDPA